MVAPDEQANDQRDSCKDASEDVRASTELVERAR
jgi:hypothetical protein